jgi:hypothetical protein
VKEMGEFEESARRIGQDFHKADMNGAWQEFGREIQKIEGGPGSQRDKAQKEAQYIELVIKQNDELKKLGFPSATIHQDGKNLQFEFNDPKHPGTNWDTMYFSTSSFTQENTNKSSHDITVDEAKKMVPLQGNLVETGEAQPPSQPPTDSQSPNKGGTDAHGPYVSGTDASDFQRQKQQQDYATEQIGWQQWANRIQENLQNAVATNPNLQALLQNTDGKIHFQFSVDQNHRITGIYAADSHAVHTIAEQQRIQQINHICAQIVKQLNQTTDLTFPQGTQYSQKPFTFDLPYGVNVQSGQHYEHVQTETKRTPVMHY